MPIDDPEMEKELNEMIEMGPIDKKEITDMISFFEDSEVVEKKEEIPLEKVEEEDKKEEKKEIETPPEKKEEEKVEEKKVEVDEKDLQLATLREELNRLSGLLARDGKEQVFPPVEKKAEEKEVEKEKKPKREVNEIFNSLYDKKEFLSKEQLDQVIDKPELINEAIYNSRTEMADLLAEVIPQIVNIAVNREVIVHKAVSSFYEANPDLIEHSKYVQMVLREEEEKDRNKPYSEIFMETASVCRKRLGLKEPVSMSKQQELPAQSKETKPAFAGVKSGTSTPISKGGKKEIFDMNAADLMDRDF